MQAYYTFALTATEASKEFLNFGYIATTTIILCIKAVNNKGADQIVWIQADLRLCCLHMA